MYSKFFHVHPFPEFAESDFHIKFIPVNDYLLYISGMYIQRLTALIKLPSDNHLFSDQNHLKL